MVYIDSFMSTIMIVWCFYYSNDGSLFLKITSAVSVPFILTFTRINHRLWWNLLDEPYLDGDLSDNQWAPSPPLRERNIWRGMSGRDIAAHQLPFSPSSLPSFSYLQASAGTGPSAEATSPGPWSDLRGEKSCGWSCWPVYFTAPRPTM